MKRLNKQQQARQTEVNDALEAKRFLLEAAIGKHNEAVKLSWADVETALGELNSAIEEANNFREEINTDQEGYFDEKSEKWQEGDAGSNYSEWRDAWSNELPEVEMDEPDEVEMPDTPTLSEDEYPTEPS